MHRLSTLAIAAFLVLGNITLCPSGRCPMTQGAGRDCCSKGQGLKSPDCCPTSFQRGAPRLAATGGAHRTVASPLALHLSAAFVPPSPRLDEARRFAAIAPGPAPPGSLLARHTSLLL